MAGFIGRQANAICRIVGLLPYCSKLPTGIVSNTQRLFIALLRRAGVCLLAASDKWKSLAALTCLPSVFKEQLRNGPIEHSTRAFQFHQRFLAALSERG